MTILAHKVLGLYVCIPPSIPFLIPFEAQTLLQPPHTHPPPSTYVRQPGDKWRAYGGSWKCIPAKNIILSSDPEGSIKHIYMHVSMHTRRAPLADRNVHTSAYRKVSLPAMCWQLVGVRAELILFRRFTALELDLAYILRDTLFSRLFHQCGLNLAI